LDPRERLEMIDQIPQTGNPEAGYQSERRFRALNRRPSRPRLDGVESSESTAALGSAAYDVRPDPGFGTTMP
jgi:hypothetical protein